MSWHNQVRIIVKLQQMKTNLRDWHSTARKKTKSTEVEDESKDGISSVEADIPIPWNVQEILEISILWFYKSFVAVSGEFVGFFLPTLMSLLLIAITN